MRLRHIGLAVFVLTLLALLITSPILAGPAHQAAPPAQGTTTASANLRAGPGTTFAKTGALPAGATVKITGCNDTCDWYKLDSGAWIAAILVKPAAAAPAPSTPAAAQAVTPFTVAGWNIGLDDADPTQMASELAVFDGVDLWGLASRLAPRWARTPTLWQSWGPLSTPCACWRSTTPAALTCSIATSWTPSTPRATRVPRVLHLRDKVSGVEFLFMVNHLYRSKDAERAHQAQLLNEWAAGQTLPVVAVGDYNFDWSTAGGAANHDAGYDLMTTDGVWDWLERASL